jgi:hypothetical protein
MLQEEADLDEEDAVQDEIDRRVAEMGMTPHEAMSLHADIRAQVRREYGFDKLQDSLRMGLHARSAHLKYGAHPTKSQEPRFSFGTGNRVGRAKMYSPGPMNKDMEGRDSPGPNTRVRRDGFGKTIVDGGTPVYSFGGKGVERNPVETPANIHGPASVGATAMFGKQSSSKNKTAARAKIGTATRGGASKVYAPGSLNSGFGSKVPGPQYDLDASLHKQSSSLRKNAPVFGFGTSKRMPSDNKSAADVPGPGAYGGQLAPPPE